MPTIFHEPWWLELATAGRWQEVEVRHAGRVAARLPISLHHRLGLRSTGMPPLTHFLGPAVDPGPGGGPTRWLRQVELTRELVRRLPPLFRFWQKFHRGVADVVAFQTERFMTQMQFTFEVAPAPEAVLWAAMRDKTRNAVRKGQRDYVVQDLPDPAEFARLYRANLQRIGRRDWMGAGVMAPLVAATLERRAGHLLGVRDGRGDLAAAIFCPQDAAVSYYSLSTRRPDSGNGAIPALVWEAMRRAAAAGLVFDFDGLASAGSIGLYAGFGGVTRPRYIAHSHLLAPIARKLRRAFGLNTSTFGS